FRQGDIGTSWYAVLSGSLDVKVSETANHQKYRQSMAGLLAPPYGAMESGSNNDRLADKDSMNSDSVGLLNKPYSKNVL
ncbi:hypothetical protein CRUP_020758, partial [Coryphaenoides rupestris]